MPWSLEIHHLGVGQGDATLILAKEWDNATPANLLRTRSALIDGGDWGASNVLIPYIRARVKRLNVAAITHFDGDHYRGFIEMLEDGTRLIKHTRIYDQGRASFGTPYEGGTGVREYRRYLNAVAAAQNRMNHTLTRVTERVNSFFIMNLDVNRNHLMPQHGDFAIPADIANGTPVQAPDWLVGREILWDGTVQPAGAPTITCIAANKWVRQANGTTAFRSGVSPYLDVLVYRNSRDVVGRRVPEPVASVNCTENADSNGKSLAFLVEFGGFRYYLGGDLEDEQETPLAAAVNPANNAAGRVHAMKASHHGSDLSTTDTFVARMRPSAVFISCGRRNTHGHPTSTVIETLEADASVQHWYLTELPYRPTSETGIAAEGYQSVSALAHERALPLTCTPGHVPCNPHRGVAAYEWHRQGLAPNPDYKHAILGVTAAQAAGTAPSRFSVGVLRGLQWTLNTTTGVSTFVPNWFSANHT